MANGVKANLERDFEVRTWDDDVFEPGDFTLEALESFTHQFDAAVLVLGPDDTVVSRGVTLSAPRDNVVLEAGMFYGALGRKRVFLLAPEPASSETHVKLPSDLLGMSILHYHEPSDANYRAATATACVRLAKRLNDLLQEAVTLNTGPFNRQVQAYESLQAARDAIAAELAICADLKVLANKGLQLFGLDASAISMADLERYPRLRKIRIILMDELSPWITEGLATLRRYESRDSFVSELKIQHAIAEASMKRAHAKKPLHKSGIRYHLNEPYFRIIMTENMAFVSSYADPPEVQVRDLPVFVIKDEPGSIYGAIKRHFNDLWHNHSRPGKFLSDTQVPEQSAGGLVYWSGPDGVPWVALVKRSDGSWVLPKGHREVPDDNLELTALREVSEETGLVADHLRIVRLLSVYAVGDSERYELESGKVVHIFLIRCTSPVRPSLIPDADHPDAAWWRLDERLPYLLYGPQRTLIAESAKRDFDLDVDFE